MLPEMHDRRNGRNPAQGQDLDRAAAANVVEDFIGRGIDDDVVTLQGQSGE